MPGLSVTHRRADLLLTPSHLEYFCVTEKNLEDKAWKEMLLSPLSEILDSGHAVYCKVSDKKILIPESNDYRFRDNEQVYVINAGASEETLYKNLINTAQTTRIEGVLNTGEIVTSSGIAGKSVIIGVAEPLTEYYEWQKNIVQKWLVPSGLSAAQIIAFLKTEAGLEEHIPLEDDVSYNDILNMALSEEITLLQGPPGCGKTYSAAQIIKLALEKNLSVGVFSFTNRAVDNLILSLAKKYPALAGQVVRSGNRPEWEKTLQKTGIAHDAKFLFPNKGLVHATTLYRLTNKANSLISEATAHDMYDLTIIDEASQMTLPMMLPVLVWSKHTLLMGDHKQLPPLIHGKPVKEVMNELYTSAFEYLIKRKKAYFLCGTWRMREEVALLPSRAFYNSELKSRFPVKDLNWPHFDDDPLCSQKDGVVLFEFNTEPKGKKASQAQAQFVVNAIAKIENLLGAFITDIEKRLGDTKGLRYIISCFYRSQVSMIRAMLGDIADKVDIARIRIDTVERNQGQTATIGFLSTGNPLSDTQSTEWILDPRRLNVAITRARLKTIVTAPRDYVEMAVKERCPALSCYKFENSI
ncbi:MAG: AAA family ATPase [Deltaproteobacteria bacterium]|nr:AAA family ATPase [Deltaproteobacteria bacterium]